jgi:hypothetical protein
MLKPTTFGGLSRSLYPVIYAKNPWEHAPQIATELINNVDVLPWLDDILESIDDCLTKSGWLDELGPLAGGHSEDDVKKFLVALRAGLGGGIAPNGGIALRVMAGEKCTQAGFWFTPARVGSRRYLKIGDLMPEVGGDYGSTIWQWDQNQDSPIL